VLEPETANRKHSALPEVKNWRGVSFSSAVETDRISESAKQERRKPDANHVGQLEAQQEANDPAGPEVWIGC
jgi:hypothetical protein